MASYTIAHLKLGMTLKELKAGESQAHLGIYLTNTLEKPKFSDWAEGSMFVGVQESITREALAASKIKSEYPIMCVIGNPPYSGISQNKIYKDNNVYKVEIGGKEKLKEKKNWLDDDYVKFIRFSESLIEKNGEGILGMITAHGYIDNPTFRGMRWHLRNTFDKIYILDLHGNSRKKETTPDGKKDENVFDIMTGVAIILGIKKPNKVDKKLAQVYKADFFGLRKDKFKNLEAATVDKVEWEKLPEDTDLWVLEGEGKNEYQEGFSLGDFFLKKSVGIVTMGDNFIIDRGKDSLVKRLHDFLDNNISSEDLKIKYELGKNYANWIVGNKKKISLDEDKIVAYSYRPFDNRFTIFDKNLIWRVREEVMKDIPINKFSLVFEKQSSSYQPVGVFLSKNIIDCHLTGGQSYIGNLYSLAEDKKKQSNLDAEIVDKMEKVVGKVAAEDVFDYVYAVLHSPRYRDKYKEFLRIDFPRVPYPAGKKEFERLVKLGTKLRALHLMVDPECERLATKYPVRGGNAVEKVRYDKGKVYINNSQYFEDVPEVAWGFYVGAYQPAQKYLKDRKGMVLTSDEIDHYQKIIKVLIETDKLMKEIDKP